MQAEALANYEAETDAEKKLEYQQQYLDYSNEILDVQLEMVETEKTRLELLQEQQSILDQRIGLADSLLNYALQRAQAEKGSALTEQETLDIQKKFYAQQWEIYKLQKANIDAQLVAAGIDKPRVDDVEYLATLTAEQLQLLQEEYNISGKVYESFNKLN